MPRLNAVMERWVRSCRTELLDRALIWNQAHLLHALCEYEQCYNQHRPQRILASAAPLRPVLRKRGHTVSVRPRGGPHRAHRHVKGKCLCIRSISPTWGGARTRNWSPTSPIRRTSTPTRASMSHCATAAPGTHSGCAAA
ncbi:hypothetical protein [Streptomyces sp. CA-106131]|uniref:hypothetical protein n=1 Tax=Streptomyces sp. CA-106131 TaxID=3240045 RepID=UPI003D89E5BE